MIFKSLYFIVSLLGSSLAFTLMVIFAFFSFAENVFFELILVFLVSSVAIFVLRIFFRGKRRNVKGFERKLLRKGVHKSKVKAFLAGVEERSFASSHVARLSGVGTVLFFNNFPYEWLLLVFVLALLVGFARVRLQRHNSLDVFTGFIIGVLSGYLAVEAYVLLF